MIRIPTLAALAVVLAGCGTTADGEPAAVEARPNPIRPIFTQTYTPGRIEAQPEPRRAVEAPSAQADGPPAPRPPAQAPPPRRRGGGSIPSPFGDSPTAPPAIIAPPVPGPSTDATARFKRDLFEPRVQELRTQDALGRLDPPGQRELLMRQQELHRLQVDPLRR